MSEKLPQFTGTQLIKLFKKDGWIEKRRSKHGVSMFKKISEGKTLVIIIPTKKGTLPEGTLGGILGTKQSGIGKKGLKELIEKYKL
jgi:predicted RNA binding protein YcfA (HicA-like mRNA interferase family)